MQPDSRPPKNFRSNRLLRFLASLRLTIWLIFLIAFGSIFGTFIPQSPGALHDARHLPDWVIRTSDSLMLYDVYHSYWYSALIVLLCLNIICCLALRFPATLKFLRPGQQNNPSGKGIALDLSDERYQDFRRQFEDLCRSRFTKVECTAESIRAERGRLTRLSGYLLHLGIIVIVAGMAISHLHGFQAHLNLPEGATADSIIQASGEVKKLDFEVRCDNFGIEFYDNGMPKEYKTDLTFLPKTAAPQTREVRVNYPVDFGGLRFYQADYTAAARAALSISGDEGLFESEVIAGSAFSLGEATVHILRIEQNLMDMGPAVEVGIISPEERLRFWVFKNIRLIRETVPDLYERAPVFNPGQYEPYLFSLKGVEPIYYSGLMVNYDPGAKIAALGSVFFLLGLFFLILGNHIRVWGTFEQQSGRVRISMHSSRNRADQEINQLIADFKGSAE